MFSNISPTLATHSVQQNPAVKVVSSSPSKGAASNEDTVQLSPETQKYITNTKTSSPAQPSITQIIKEAADGDISALAKLELIA